MEPDNNHIDPIGLLPRIFAGEATSEEQRIVDEWLVLNDSNKDEYNAFARLWNITGAASLPGDIDLEAEWKKMNAVITHSSRSFRLVRAFQIAAAIVLISSLAFLGIKFSFTRSSAPVADISVSNLPDGTRVTLNAGSKIIYRKGFGITHRNLNLRGEAYFEVEKNTALPFIIDAGDVRIQVTGTKFNVKAYQPKDVVRVTVTEGSVRLYEADKPHRMTLLAAGETGIFNRNLHVIKKQTIQNLNDISWKTGIIDFYNTSIDEVADILANTYHQPIEVDPIVKHCSVTVRFENQPLDSVFRVLKSTLDLTISTSGRRKIISGKGC